MTSNASDVVSKALETYAERGVFRGFSELKRRGPKRTFTFLWHTSCRMEFSLDGANGLLTFRNLLPNVAPGSALHAELKSFLEERSNGSLPKHRRIDKRRAEVRLYNRGGNVSVALKVKNNGYAYGLNKIVNLVHELFVHLNATQVDYMCENFDARSE